MSWMSWSMPRRVSVPSQAAVQGVDKDIAMALGPNRPGSGPIFIRMQVHLLPPAIPSKSTGIRTRYVGNGAGKVKVVEADGRAPRK